MRKSSRALLLVVVSLVGCVGLAVGAAFSAAFAFGAVALLVPGTGTPNANVVAGYLQNAENYYLRDTSCTGSSCTLRGIDYPASFYPLAIIPGWCRSGPEGCDKWDESVGQGVGGGPLGPGLKQELADALATTPEGGRDIVVFGYSQGGAVVSKLLNESNLTVEQKQRIQVVTIGGIENPDGGLWQRLAPLTYIPFLDITFAPPMPVDPDLQTTTIGFEYDPVVYAPRYWGNPVALLNAFAAFATVHGNYLEPNGKDGSTPGTLPYGYTPPTATDPGTLLPQLDCSKGGHPENCRYDKAGNAYIMIPATSLPMYDLALSLLPPQARPFAKPFVDLVTPVTKVLVDLGYDWSGDPGTPTPLSILPFNPNQNFAKVGVDVVAAAFEGVQHFVADLQNLGGPAANPTSTAGSRTQALGALSRLSEGDASMTRQNGVVQLSTLAQNTSEVVDVRPGGTSGALQQADAQVQTSPGAGIAPVGATAAPVGQVGQTGDQKSASDNVVVLNRTGGSQQVTAKKPTTKPSSDLGKQWNKAVDDVKKLFGQPGKKTDDKPAGEVKKADAANATKKADAANAAKKADPAEGDGPSEKRDAA